MAFAAHGRADLVWDGRGSGLRVLVAELKRPELTMAALTTMGFTSGSQLVGGERL